MACFVEGWSVGEIDPIGNSVKHQTPLVQGRCGVPEEVVQQDLIFVSDKANAKKRKSGTDIVEFEALAFVQCPVGMGQIKS